MYQIGEAEIEAVARVIRSGRLFRYQKGPNGEPSESAQFEREYAQKMGAPHALAVTSGTAALICGLIGLEVGPGDEVIVPGYTFMATALAPLAVGAVPVLGEVDAGLMLDPADVERKITPRTKAIIPVHMNGHVANLDDIVRVARKAGVKVLEDCCQCVGGSYRGLRVGRHGDAGAYSFNYYKNITSGEGGAIVTSDGKIHQRARMYHDSGAMFRVDAKDFTVPVFAGVNYRVDEVRSAIMRVQLQRLDEILSSLRRRWSALRERLQGKIEFAPVHDRDGVCGSYLLLRLGSRQEALAFTKAASERRIPSYLPHDSGRHVYWNWDPLLERRGAHHPAFDPLQTELGRKQQYSVEMLPKTREHLERSAFVNIDVNWTEEDLDRIANGLIECANVAESASLVMSHK
ncbi:MAG TPA: DegT/DnrJ/EryC1/StrS family aminotransferase [Planctomycetota bacterium]|nr:DegT/DnrJ/EryC1/StrS family aminotransferase [Planctomycetota bacterium]